MFLRVSSILILHILLFLMAKNTEFLGKKFRDTFVKNGGDSIYAAWQTVK